MKALFLPLLGPSYFHRSKKHKILAILKLPEIFFSGKNILDFYRSYDVKIKIYGETLNIKKIAGLDMQKSIMELEDSTSCHKRHTIYYGIFSSTDFPLEFAKKIVRFHEWSKREPSHQEKVSLYYGENINTADLLYYFHKDVDLGSPPTACLWQTTGNVFFRCSKHVSPDSRDISKNSLRFTIY